MIREIYTRIAKSSTVFLNEVSLSRLTGAILGGINSEICHDGLDLRMDKFARLFWCFLALLVCLFVCVVGLCGWLPVWYNHSAIRLYFRLAWYTHSCGNVLASDPVRVNKSDGKLIQPDRRLCLVLIYCLVQKKKI